MQLAHLIARGNILCTYRLNTELMLELFWKFAAQGIPLRGDWNEES